MNKLEFNHKQKCGGAPWPCHECPYVEFAVIIKGASIGPTTLEMPPIQYKYKRLIRRF